MVTFCSGREQNHKDNTSTASLSLQVTVTCSKTDHAKWRWWTAPGSPPALTDVALMPSWCTRQPQRRKLGEETDFGLHYEFQDFWAVTYKQATRCCCKARKGPDGRVREMCREGGERSSKEGSSPSFSLSANKPTVGTRLCLAQRQQLEQTRLAFLLGCSTKYAHIHTIVLCNWWKDPKARWKLTVYISKSFIYCW